MFWGLIMEPQKKYTQVVKKPFHISNAALDLSTGTSEQVQVMCGYDNRKYLLCTLDQKVYQCPLDLNFDVGVEVSFITNGTSNVHLSGYLVHEDADLFDDDDVDEEEDEVSLGNITTSNIVSGKRAKGKAEGQLNGLTGKLRKKLEALSKSAPPAKKLKTMELLQSVNDDDDSEDDADVDLSDLLVESDDDDDDEVEEEENEEYGAQMEEEDDDGDEEEDEDDEEDDDDDLAEDSDVEDEEDAVFDLLPQNGTVDKKKAKPATAEKEKKSPNKSKSSPKKTTVEGGVQVEELRAGTGAAAKAGKMVRVYYEGRFQKTNKTFDAATKGKGFAFRLGRGEVIKGWDVGVEGMRVGGKRRIVCPPAMAYGARGSPPTIPPNSTLVFDVELRHVN